MQDHALLVLHRESSDGAGRRDAPPPEGDYLYARAWMSYSSR